MKLLELHNELMMAAVVAIEVELLVHSLAEVLDKLVVVVVDNYYNIVEVVAEELVEDNSNLDDLDLLDPNVDYMDMKHFYFCLKFLEFLSLVHNIVFQIFCI